MMGSQDKWAVRGSVAGLLVVLCFLAGFSLLTQDRVADESKRADTAVRLSATYQEARHWVTEAKSTERRYHFEGSSTVRLAHEQAGQHLAEDLAHVIELDPSAQPTVARLLELSRRYRTASRDLFAAIDRNDSAAVQRVDHEVIDPIFGVLEYLIHQQADAARTRALEHSASLRQHQAHATRAMSRRVRGRPRAPRLLRLRHRARCAVPRSRGSRRSPSATRSPACATTARSRRTWRASSSGSAAAVSRCRWSCSTSTASRRSTTRSATRPATSASRPPPRRSATHGARAISPTASAATSSP